jgi:hypothetical protein
MDDKLKEIDSEIMTPQQVSEYCGFSLNYAHRLFDSGKIPHITRGTAKLTIRKFVEPFVMPKNMRRGKN